MSFLDDILFEYQEYKFKMTKKQVQKTFEMILTHIKSLYKIDESDWQLYFSDFSGDNEYSTTTRTEAISHIRVGDLELIHTDLIHQQEVKKQVKIGEFKIEDNPNDVALYEIKPEAFQFITSKSYPEITIKYAVIPAQKILILIKLVKDDDLYN